MVELETVKAKAEATLRWTEERIVEIEKELAPYQLYENVDARIEEQALGAIADHTDAQDAPIGRCLDDVLYTIFEFCLVPRHRRIGTLLLVCRRWNRMVMNGPKLWARLQVESDDDLLKDTAVHAYLSACIERSRGLHLDVELDLSHFPSCRMYLEQEVVAFAKSLVNSSDHESVETQMEELDWDLESEQYSRLLTGALERILGTNGSRLPRLASLSLVFPEDDEDTAVDVWSHLKGNLLNLKALTIDHLPIGEEQISRLRDLAEHGIPHFPVLERLAIVDADDGHDLRVFSLAPDSLTFLQVAFDPIAQNFEAIAAFTQLHTLELHVFPSDRKCLLDSSFARPVHWPCLKEVILAGHYEYFGWLNIDCPSLATLTIRCDRLTYPIPQNVSPSRIRWKFEVDDEEYLWMSPLDIYDAVMVLTDSKMGAKCLIVPESARLAALAILSLRRAETSAVPRTSIVQLEVEYRTGYTEWLDLDGIISELTAPPEQVEEEAIHREILWENGISGLINWV